MKKILPLLIISLISFLCKSHIQPEKPETLYEKYRKAVVLIKNEFYFQINFNNGVKAYFTETTDEGISDLTFMENEARAKSNILYGTGFFISNDGKIATNRHVISPQIKETSLLNSLKIKFDNFKFKIQDLQNEYSDSISNLENFISNNYYDLSTYDIEDLRLKEDSYREKRNNLSNLNLVFDFDPSKSEIETKSTAIGIAFDNTFITKSEDFQECVPIRISKDDDIDLAIIQTKAKTTPSNVTTVFDFADHNPNLKNGTLEKDEGFDLNKSLKIDTKVYMVGYNYGLNLSNTSDGLKVQLTQGTVSQESDKSRVLYSIPSLQGSSGSPIIDQWGNLVAINFAKIGSQSFNYGILSKHLKRLLEE